MTLSQKHNTETMEDNSNKQIINFQPSLPTIKNVGGIIVVTSNLVQEKIEKLFNEAFCLLNINSKIDKSINYYQKFATDVEYRKKQKFEELLKIDVQRL